jgi:hypothetical protein
MPYRVLVDDNYHFMDESERHEVGEFQSYDEAVQASKRIVDDFLLSSFKPGMTASELFKGYTDFGEDPFIVAVDPSPHMAPSFSAWEYAKVKCEGISSPGKTM